ncbi:MAG: hypothetical protein ACI97A_001875 [Planctomycetota bacterium]|jgi:hypothetical protein
MNQPHQRQPAKPATKELLCLQKWEEMADWFLETSSRWPKSVRFTLTQRLQNHVLDVLELLVELRYQPQKRVAGLREVNLQLTRIRYLLRLVHKRKINSVRSFEFAMRQIDEVGRMLHGWGENAKSRAVS